MKRRPAALVVFDCEFLTAPGAPQRFWCGPDDPDPIIAQVGAAKIALTGDFPISGTWSCIVRPRGRDGAICTPDPLFTRLTGISSARIASDGIELPDALAALEAFSDGETLWSWGKDEFNLIAISCYVAGVAPPLPATRFANACRLLQRAGMPTDDIHETRSNTLASRLGVDHPPLRSHDALDDALNVAYSLQHLLRRGDLRPAHLVP